MKAIHKLSDMTTQYDIYDPKKYNSKHKKDCLWKQRSHYGLENRNLGFIATLH